MADLTGGIPESICPLDENMDEIWTKLLSLCEGGHLIGAVSVIYLITNFNPADLI